MLWVPLVGDMVGVFQAAVLVSNYGEKMRNSVRKGRTVTEDRLLRCIRMWLVNLEVLALLLMGCCGEFWKHWSDSDWSSSWLDLRGRFSATQVKYKCKMWKHASLCYGIFWNHVVLYKKHNKTTALYWFNQLKTLIKVTAMALCCGRLSTHVYSWEVQIQCWPAGICLKASEWACPLDLAQRPPAWSHPHSGSPSSPSSTSSPV